jgi:hypothetical protein
VHAVFVESILQVAITERLDELDFLCKILQGALVLGTGLARAVAEVVACPRLGFRLSGGLGQSLSDSFSCTLDLGTRLTRAVAEIGDTVCR